MATIKSRSNQISVIDGGSLDTTADLGVSFGCRNGVCGRCASRSRVFSSTQRSTMSS